ncbi:hypothetical protein, variant 1 [Phialophora macrospora]|uniref:Uncharacterized protein n=1 Tax=Phialophora macrospora TaxID=1851006 RepID=A0A0D2G0A1_9EURO|nr:hypothetical protein, variant 1 [Phialophora macrospora]
MNIPGDLASIVDLTTSIHNSIGDHTVGKADLCFQLLRYQTYNDNRERELIDKSIHNPSSQSCLLIAKRLLTLHKAIIDWLRTSGFKLHFDRHRNITWAQTPCWFLGKKANSLREHVDIIENIRDQLVEHFLDRESDEGTRVKVQRGTEFPSPPRLQSEFIEQRRDGDRTKKTVALNEQDIEESNLLARVSTGNC